MSPNHWPEDERPREKLLRLGPTALSEAELLAILLQTGTRGRSAIDAARGMLSEFKSLRGLLSADRALVCRVPGLGDAKFAMLKASLELARRHYAEPMLMGVWPATVDAIAGPPPPYGTCTRSRLRPDRNSSPVKWDPEPGPAEA